MESAEENHQLIQPLIHMDRTMMNSIINPLKLLQSTWKKVLTSLLNRLIPTTTDTKPNQLIPTTMDIKLNQLIPAITDLKLNRQTNTTDQLLNLQNNTSQRLLQLRLKKDTVVL